ncbi:hypothetical protein KKF69_04205 [Patescibacteria group bacterium]|nr:hypothetical protein [Patescibacteria group bacterium]
MNKSSHLDTAKAITSFFIVLIGFGVFMLFYTNSESLIEGNSFSSFITLTVIVFSLLIGLLYLVSNSKHPRVHTQRASVKKNKKSRK